MMESGRTALVLLVLTIALMAFAFIVMVRTTATLREIGCIIEARP